MADSKFISLTGLGAFLKKLNTDITNKVDKVDGKELSKNDFTDELKAKLDGIQAQATKTVIDAELKDSTNPVQNKVIKAALGNKIDSSTKGQANGVASLDASGKIQSSQLPGSVDEIIEGYFNSNKFFKEEAHTNEITGEASKIYVDLKTNKTYRYSGSGFVEISSSLALGETASTAYYGDKGKAAYVHSQAAHAPSNAEHNQNAFSNVTVGNVTVAAASATDTFTIGASGASTVTADASKKTIIIKSTDTKYTAATQSQDGLMSKTDKTKLDGLTEATEAEILALFTE